MNARFRVSIKQSPIDGLGVFADERIPRGAKISYYTGVEMSYSEVKRRYGDDWRFIYRTIPWLDQVVSKDCKNLIDYVNDGVHGQTVPSSNCYLKSRWLIASRDIEPGEELLLNYGALYWKRLEKVLQKN
jgi:SET domain-containing protein